MNINEVSIIESRMTFGPYDVNHCFNIEKSQLYKTLGPGIRIAEFALLRLTGNGSAEVWLIEAKSSAPQPMTLPQFDDYIAEITQKMCNTVQILMAAVLNRHANTTELSANFKALTLATTRFKCILVINGHQEAWLPPLQEALVKALTPLVKTMALGPKSVAVMNEVIARQHGLITS
jgi:hypothetical protein